MPLATHRYQHATGLMLVVFVLLASMYNIVVPPGEGPDEPGHFNYVLFLAREGRLPQPADVPGEGHQPPLTYALMLPAVLWLPPDARSITQTANPAFAWNGSGGDEHAAFRRATQERVPWSPTITAWHLARFISTLFATVALVGIAGAARALAPPAQRDLLPLLVVLLVVAIPQYSFTAALVTNDTLLAALAALVVWRALTLAPPTAPRRQYQQVALLGGLVGLALLTKLSGLVLVPFVVWAVWRVSPTLAHAARRVLLCGAVAAAVAGWWFLRNLTLTGDILGLGAFSATYATQPFVWHDPTAWAAALWQLYASSLAFFGWLTLPAPLVVGLCSLLLLLAGGGLLWRLRGVRWQPAVLRSPWVGLAGLAALAGVWVTSFALVAGLVAWQGRLLLPALPALLLLAAGLAALPALRGWVAPPLLLVVLGVATHAGALQVLATSYPANACLLPAPPTSARANAAPGAFVPTYARYAKPWEQGVTLHGWTHNGGQGATLAPGDVVTLHLRWHGRERLLHDWTVFVHVVNATGDIVAESNSQPCGSIAPFTQWTPGDWYRDPHSLTLPPDLAAGTYTVRVGLYLPWQRDPQQGRRLEAWDAANQPLGDAPIVGTLDVAPVATAP